jgi:hypothetical protein
LLERLDVEFRANGGPIVGIATPPERLPPPAALEWKLDTPSLQAVELASSNGFKLARSIDLKLLLWPHFGKGLMKRYGLVPDFFVQMAIQLAYRRLHGRCVATYETAQTRLFYHGRTETIRVCSEQSVSFCAKMLDPAESVSLLLVVACMVAHGCITAGRKPVHCAQGSHRRPPRIHP